MKTNYTIIGDSLVYGIGGYEQNGWVSMFKNALLNEDDTKETTNYVHCVGFPGATSKDISEKIEAIREVYCFPEIQNVFLLSVGINNTQIIDGTYKRSVEDYQKDLLHIIKTLKKLENSTVVFLGLTRVQSQEPFLWKPNKYFDNQVITQYDEVLKKVCDDFDCMYIPMSTVLENDDYIDGLHPNDLGYRKIKERVMNSIMKRFYKR